MKIYSTFAHITIFLSYYQPQPKFDSKKEKFRYGNYDRYYGYRNSGTSEDDVRLSMLKEEWFAGKDCLDVGSNTGQVSVFYRQPLL